MTQLPPTPPSRPGPAPGPDPAPDPASGPGLTSVQGDVDVAVIGAGAAGLALTAALADGSRGARTPSVVLLEAPPGPLRPGDRTWCFWEDAHGWEDAVCASWPRIQVAHRDGTRTDADVSPMRYRMIRSRDFESAARRRWAGRPQVRTLSATVTDVRDGPGGATVHYGTPDGAARALRARWVFDSRPLPRLPPARTTLLQHFRGWFVRLPEPAFDPGAAVLMDLRTPQPRHGLSFGYVLPLSEREALVEYTEFSRQVLDRAGYDHALRDYTERTLGLGPLTVTATEQGVIPMTDAVFPRSAGRSVFRVGAAGGATRPSTGYTFAAALRQAEATAAAYHAGGRPVPPAAHRPWSRAMDAVLLRALDTGRVDGADFFSRLFRNNPAPRLLRFLGGTSTLPEDLRIGTTTPVWPMLRTSAEVPLVRRRPARPSNRPGS
ncbi:lycopene cyclase family protein [Streptomyces sp. 549]|uniref:lycopene cyclase family protein n=1 Tax=Streptomyces sp. 549 TaxID=3049076 RepID=UPI0024C34985|nr:lycopene cyclase family protein [Streptomyces sp. 549]MDK1474595.1 lycopene cyclase family protein [Streptomyces sp. 549]